MKQLEWKITEDTYHVENHQRNETIFSLGNGYFGMRGNFEEGFHGPAGKSVNGTYINGFYESEPIHYPESAYGYAKYSQTMLHVADAKRIKISIDGEDFHLFSGKTHHYRRELDMQKGLLTREVLWESPTGKIVQIAIKRLVSLSRKHVAAISYEVKPVNFDGTVLLVSSINGKVTNQVTKDDPRSGSAMTKQVLLTQPIACNETFAILKQQTKNTKLDLIVGMDHAIEAEGEISLAATQEDECIHIAFQVYAKREQVISLTKYITYYTSLDHAAELLIDLAKHTLAEARSLGFPKLLTEQADYLQAHWQRSDVQIDGDPALQQGIRYNAYQLLQSVGRDGRTNIAAKGLTGEGYEGHYFWDTETYIHPFFLYTHPAISRRLLEYRYHTLDRARRRAREMNQKGALYPWRTINGDETSAYYPAGTAQVHINADIIYALKKYVKATGDWNYLLEQGAEMTFETSRFWLDLGYYNPRKQNLFCIDAVTGPDEYTAIVNNNAFTNLMVKDCLEFAAETAHWMEQNHPEKYEQLSRNIGLEKSEVEAWSRAAEHMYIPYDAELGIVAQDDTFLDKQVWDFANTPKDRYPLLLHYHPLVIYRHQVLKQADVVLALFLQSNRFSQAEKKRNYQYYEPITTHDSSLSPCTHSIIAAEIGDLDQAYTYFDRTVRMDLDDINGNVKDGIHTASMAGSWLSIVHGFAGMRDEDGLLHFQPVVPSAWQGYRFKIAYQGRMIEVSIDRERAAYTLLEGDPITIYHRYQKLSLVMAKSRQVSMKKRMEAVIFDLDGVITDTADFHYQAWKQLAEELDIPFDRSFNERLKGISRMASLELMLSQTDRSYSAYEKEALAAKKNRYYNQLIDTITPDHLLPGIERLLQELRLRGIKIGLASASKNAEKVVTQLQIKPYFHAIVDVSRVKKGKPDPEIFYAAAEQLGVIPGHCIAIEDAAAGVHAIKNANMVAVGIGDPDILHEADVVVSNTEQLSFDFLNYLNYLISFR